MYFQLRGAVPTRSDSRWRLWQGVSATVLYLGVTSLFTDISSEMVSTILPLYFVLALGFTPLQFGILDGLYQGAAALIRVAAGLAADRWRRYKVVAFLGYALSALCKPGLLLVGLGWPFLAGLLLIDRTGKGIRTAPRDAMISLATPEADLGAAFGAHRALDTLGALIGPLLAFGLLTLTPGRFDTIFVVSFCAALVGLGVLGLFVEPPQPAAERAIVIPPPPSLGSVVQLLREARFRLVVIAGALLGLVTISDAFVYLALQHRSDFNPNLLPLLFVATAVVYFVLALPAGRLADRFGRGRVFVAGYVLLALVYLLLLLPVGPFAIGALVFLGAYYAATDGVLMALASPLLSAELRTSGLALVTTATGIARLLASVLFGAIWTYWGISAAIWAFLLALALVVALVAMPLSSGKERHAPPAV
jgi:MFS family permease